MVWNCGPGCLVDKKGNLTALAKAINANDTEAIEREWMKRVRGRDGLIKKELVTRRPIELAMMAGKVDPKDLLVCNYAGLDVSKISRNGMPIKTEAAYSYMRTACAKPCDPSLMRKKAWFNYGVPVSKLVGELPSSQTEKAPRRLATEEFSRVTISTIPVGAAVGRFETR